MINFDDTDENKSDLSLGSKLYQIAQEHGQWAMASRVSNTMASATISAKILSGTGAERYQSKIRLGSYNYSGLSGHPEIIAAAVWAVKKYGTSTSGVRLLNGTIDLPQGLMRLEVVDKFENNAI